ncbi:hypothetical protein ACOSP7_014942 [Xanthoceras sorbifolium]
MKCFKGWCPDPKKRYQHSKKAARKGKDVAQLHAQGKFDEVSYRNIPGETWHTSFEGYQAFGSRMSTLKNILNALTNPHVNMVGVYGMGGVGKTTLAREVAKQAEGAKLFDEVVFAEVSETPDIKKLQEVIGDKLGLEFREKSESGRARSLFARLKEEENILVILDNIWGSLDLEKVGIPIRNNHGGCKLLFTARSRDVLSNEMDCLTNFPIGVLNDEEAWSMFKRMAGACIDDHRGLRSIAIEVANACGGVPIAIVTIAKALRNKEVYEWTNALQELRRPSTRNFEGVAAEAYSSIEFSYNHIKDEELKSTFLLCSIMGYTYDASIGNLLMYGMGLRMFKSINTMVEARDRVMTLVRQLKDSSLLLHIDNGCFSMHDVVRDVARSIAFRDQHMFTVTDNVVPRDWADKDILKNCTSISLYNISELPQELLLIRDTTILTKGLFSKKLKSLINLEKIYNGRLVAEYFCQLRIIVVRECHKLKNIFSFATHHRGTLPLLEEIRVVECSNIEEIFATGREEDISNDEVIQFKHLYSLTLNRLPKFTSFCSEVMSSDGLYTPTSIFNEKVAFPSLEHMEISNIKNLEMIWHDRFAEHSFCNLRSMKVEGCNKLLCIFRSNMPERFSKLESVTFPSLEEIDISGAGKLKIIWYKQLPETSFCKLKSVKVEGCHKLLTIFQSSTLERVPRLKSLTVSNCDSLEEIFDLRGVNFEESHSATVFQLRELHFNGLPKLKLIWSKDPRGMLSFKKLCKVKVSDCQSLKSLFPASIATSLLQLEELDVDNCGVEEIVAGGNGAKSTSRFVFPRVTSLKLSYLWELRTFYSGKHTAEWQALKKLEVLECHKIESFATTIEENNEGQLDIQSRQPLFLVEKVTFPSLEEINITCADNLKIVWQKHIAEDSFSNLKAMKVERCNKLSTLFPSNTFERFSRLELLTVSDCDSLEEIFDLRGTNFEESHFAAVIHQLREVHFRGLLKLKHIWNKCPRGIRFSFQRLQKVRASYCLSLKNVFPASIATNLSQLEELHMHECRVEEIVAEDHHGEAAKAALKFVFPRITSLSLSQLPELRTFYPGFHSSKWPVLKELELSGCHKVELLASELLNFQENKKVGQPDNILAQQPLFLVKKGYFPNLEELKLKGEGVKLISQGQFSEQLFGKLKFLEVSNDESAVFPLCILQRFHNLEKLVLIDGSYEEIFSYGEVDKHAGILAQIKSLHLHQLHELKHIWKQDSKLDFILQNLEVLQVQSNDRLIDLVPSSASFHNLTILEVSSCYGLTNLVASSTARSLLRLVKMDVNLCVKMTELVANSGDATEDEIIFSDLKSLSLGHLVDLTSFCSGNFPFKFPSLEELTVNNCPNMKTFTSGVLSTARLQEFVLDGEKIQQCGEVDLNTSIQQLHEKRNTPRCTEDCSDSSTDNNRE